jgi:hypothetical protein
VFAFHFITGRQVAGPRFTDTNTFAGANTHPDTFTDLNTCCTGAFIRFADAFRG